MKSLLTRNSRLAIAAGTALCALLNFNASATVPSVIDSAYNSANGHWYYLLSNSTWSSAETAAVGLGGHLVTINDSAEDTFVRTTFMTFGGVNRDLWIGLHDTAGDTTFNAVQHAANFTWVSGDTASYRNWYPGEPNNGSGIDPYSYFGFIDFHYAGQWDDAWDTTQLPFRSDLQYGVVEVPEPTTLALIGLGGAAILIRRRK